MVRWEERSRSAEGHAISKKKIKQVCHKITNFQTNQPTLVIKSMPHSGTKELARQTMSMRQKKKIKITHLRAQVVAKAPGGIRVVVLVI